MPRTSKVEIPGCPPLRALTTDSLGLVKVVEVHGKACTPKVVEIWGSPDSSRSVIATSFSDLQKNPILAVARKNGIIELINPLNGDNLAAFEVYELGLLNNSADKRPVVGLHCFGAKNIELFSRLNVLLVCTESGKAVLASIPTKDDVSSCPSAVRTVKNWDVCSAGKVEFSSVDSNESYSLFGGKGVELNMWDLESFSRIWNSKPPRVNNLGICSPTCFSSATFLLKDDHRKIVAGTDSYKIRLYDISAQRRPVLSLDFRESPIKVVKEDSNGHTIYAGTAIGDLASFDMRTGKLLGCFVGKCCGSIRSIARHSNLPLLASCGLDSYLRIWDTRTRQLLSTVFLKQPLTNVVIDSFFTSEVLVCDASEQLHDLKAGGRAIENITNEKKKKKPSKCKRKVGNYNQMVESFELSTSEDEDMSKKTSLKINEVSMGKRSKHVKRMKNKKCANDDQ